MMLGTQKDAGLFQFASLSSEICCSPIHNEVIGKTVLIGINWNQRGSLISYRKLCRFWLVEDIYFICKDEIPLNNIQFH